MSITIKQLKSDPQDPLLGLEREGLSVFPGCDTIFEIPIIKGKPHIQLEGEEREKFEKFFNMKFDSPEGEQWLRDYNIKINHDLTALDPKNVEHQFILHVLKANNGMGIIAVNEQVIEDAPINTFKFIVSDEERELDQVVSKKEIKMRAYKELSNLYESDTKRLVTLSKFMFPINSGIGDSKQLAFNKIEEYISSNNTNAEHFLRVTKMDYEYIATHVKIKTAILKNIIRMGSDNQYFLYSANVKLGRTEEEVVAFLSDPQNIDLLGYDTVDDLPYSVSAQLKNANH